MIAGHGKDRPHQFLAGYILIQLFLRQRQPVFPCTHQQRFVVQIPRAGISKADQQRSRLPVGDLSIWQELIAGNTHAVGGKLVGCVIGHVIVFVAHGRGFHCNRASISGADGCDLRLGNQIVAQCEIILRFTSVLHCGQRAPAQNRVHGFAVSRIRGYLVDDPFGGFESNVLIRPRQRVGVDIARGYVDAEIRGIGRIWNPVFAAHASNLNAGVIVSVLCGEYGGADNHIGGMLRKVLFQKMKRPLLGGVRRIVVEFIGCRAVASVAVHFKQRAGVRVQRDVAG